MRQIFFACLQILLSLTMSISNFYIRPAYTPALRPSASSGQGEELERALVDSGDPTLKPIRLSESAEESHYWFLYQRLHKLNREIDLLVSSQGMPQDRLDERLDDLTSEFGEIMNLLSEEIDDSYDFAELSDENKRLQRNIEARYKEIERVYGLSIGKVKRSQDRHEYEVLNRDLDELNKKQLEELVRQSAVKLALAKLYCQEGPKSRIIRATRPNPGMAATLIVGVRNNMERIAIEIYWKRVRQYVRAMGTKFAQEFEDNGLFGEPTQTMALDDWDVHIRDRGKVVVRMRQWKTTVTSGGVRMVRPELVERVYPDIVVACRAQVKIMVSQHQEVLRIYSYLAQLRYVAMRIENYDDDNLPDETKDEVLASLNLFRKWVGRGFVDEKTLSDTDMQNIAEHIEYGHVKKAVAFTN
ncbi:hypothetical protein ACFL0T_03575, partial [Candidatus Omnitrophota bacterium]